MSDNLLMDIDEMDEKNAAAHGLTKSQARYKRIEGERKIKLILVLDKYIEFVQATEYKKINGKLHKRVEYKKIKRMLRKYPFKGGHFNCDVSLYCTLLCNKTFRRFLKQYNIGYELHKLLAITLDQLRDLREYKLHLTRIRRYTDVE